MLVASSWPAPRLFSKTASADGSDARRILARSLDVGHEAWVGVTADGGGNKAVDNFQEANKPADRFLSALNGLSAFLKVLVYGRRVGRQQEN